MIVAQKLVRRFGNLLAVDGISFELSRGEVVGFLGPNGAGKTTTMRMLTGYLPATSAERLEVAGHDVLRSSLEVRKRIGYLPESVPLYRELRVREMLYFQGRLHGLTRTELRQRVPAVLERVGVLDRERDLVGKLSRGLRQRVGLAVALLPDPEVLILDEPTSGLDPLQRLEVRSLVRALAEEHTVLLSSHILAEIENVCSRVIVIHHGRLVADGDRERLTRELSGQGFVRFEAALGADEARGCELIQSLPGVERVEDLGRQGIHHNYKVHGAGDLREDLGALALARTWAVRELSWRRPTLEELFARLVLGDEGEQAAWERPGEVGLPNIAAAQTPTHTLTVLESPPEPQPAPSQPRLLYSLNPFDRGRARDLSRPVSQDSPPAEGST